MIKMVFPNKGGYLDGKVHDVEPQKLYRINVTHEDMYVLLYKDVTYSQRGCITVLSKKDGKFYKCPLDDYKKVDELLKYSNEIDVNEICNDIELGEDKKIKELIDDLSNPTLASSSGGGSNPPSAPAASGGGNNPPSATASSSSGEYNPPNNPPCFDGVYLSSLIGVLRKENEDEIYIDLYKYDDEKYVNTKFEGEPRANFINYKNIEYVRTKKVNKEEDIYESSIYDERFNNISISKFLKINNGLSNSIADKMLHNFLITDILLNYKMYYSYDDELKKEVLNCISDKFIHFTAPRKYQIVSNEFESKFGSNDELKPHIK